MGDTTHMTRTCSNWMACEHIMRDILGYIIRTSSSWFWGLNFLKNGLYLDSSRVYNTHNIQLVSTPCMLTLSCMQEGYASFSPTSWSTYYRDTTRVTDHSSNLPSYSRPIDTLTVHTWLSMMELRWGYPLPSKSEFTFNSNNGSCTKLYRSHANPNWGRVRPKENPRWLK